MSVVSGCIALILFLFQFMLYKQVIDPLFSQRLGTNVIANAGLWGIFLQAAEEVDVPCKLGWVLPFGGATDSAAFKQGGFPSVGITGLNHKLEDYYHTRRDTWDNLDPQGLDNCYRATVRMLERIDAGELD